MKTESSWILIWLLHRETTRERWKGHHQGSWAPSLRSICPPPSLDHQLPLSLNQHHNPLPTCCTPSSLKHQSLPYKWNVFSYRPSLNQRILILIPAQKNALFFSTVFLQGLGRRGRMAIRQTASTDGKWDHQVTESAVTYGKRKTAIWESEIPAAPLPSQAFLFHWQPCLGTFVPKSGLLLHKTQSPKEIRQGQERNKAMGKISPTGEERWQCRSPSGLLSFYTIIIQALVAIVFLFHCCC